MNVSDFQTTLHLALNGMLDEDAYDVELDAESNPTTLQVMTDDWTLVLEDWPTGIAFISFDDEPENADSSVIRAYLTDNLGNALRAMSVANRKADGELATALIRTTDPLSNMLSEMMTEPER